MLEYSKSLQASKTIDSNDTFSTLGLEIRVSSVKDKVLTEFRNIGDILLRVRVDQLLIEH